MTDAEAITIIIDDVDLVDPLWRANSSKSTYPSKYNTTNVVFDLPSGDYAPLYHFDGSKLQLYGIAPPLAFNQTFDISTLYGSPSTGVESPEHSYHAPGYGGLQYTSPPHTILSDLFFTRVLGFALDYAVVTVYPTTELLGKTILVDDASSALIWRGSWTEENNFTLSVGCVLGFTPTFKPTSDSFFADMAPHANTTHVSQTVGDEFEFWFSGTSIFVYGITPSEPYPPWLLQMSFALDAAEPIFVNFSSQDLLSSEPQPHVVYFNASKIPAGNHTLVGRIVDVAGTVAPRARIDYITYQPSFASQAEMPVLGSSTTTSVPPASASAPGPVKTNKAAVAGGTVGGIMLCGIIIAMVMHVMRRRQRRNRMLTLGQVDEPFSDSSASTTAGGSMPFEKQSHMRLRNDTQQSLTVPGHPEPTHTRSLAGNLSQPFVGTSAVHGGDNIRLEQHDETPPLPPAQGDTEILDSRFRELQAQMQQLTREVRDQVLPPAYEGDTAGR
ncbi:hypothetical protein C8F01DRAFT_337707 [Mycena amicta]|nr:hypothetical protein C8F01DRAFT_564902 [Mycena amicta]KAJ7056892.1 hypothetical protein C8F01DRAFT_337707 [Mycena amicta]